VSALDLFISLAPTSHRGRDLAGGSPERCHRAHSLIDD
jgi:hypothetical protein